MVEETNAWQDISDWNDDEVMMAMAEHERATQAAAIGSVKVETDQLALKVMNESRCRCNYCSPMSTVKCCY